MLQRSMTHQTAVVRLLVTAIFVVLGWAYLHSALRSHGAEGPIGLSVDYRLAAPSAGSSAGIGLDSEGTRLDNPALQDEDASPPAQRRSSGHSSENQSGHRQAATILTALLVQIQSAGMGGK